MQVFHSTEEFHSDGPVIATMGMFDGIHLGHQAVLNDLIVKAKNQHAKAVLLSFWPHPRMVLQKDAQVKLLQSRDEKIKSLEQLGLDAVVFHPFTTEFSRLTSVEFVRDVLVSQIGISEFVIGYDHQFGRNREGTYEALQELSELFGFRLSRIPAVRVGEREVSSTKIRKALVAGDLAYVDKGLGRPYSILSRVEHGQKLGRKLGFPTANVALEPYKCLPPNGVYAVEVIVNGKELKGVLNLGFKPSVSYLDKPICEVHILDFTEEIYSQEIEILFKKFLRPEVKFKGKQELAIQIQADINFVRDFFNSKN